MQYIFGANFSRTDYDDEYFGFTRQDDTYGVTASGVWPEFPAKNWVMTAQVNYGFKHSTVSLFEFDRLETGVSFRKTLRLRAAEDDENKVFICLVSVGREPVTTNVVGLGECG